MSYWLIIKKLIVKWKVNSPIKLFMRYSFICPIRGYSSLLDLSNF